MTVSEAGEARIRGYLFVLDRSLRTFLPSEVARDAVREVETHIRERLEQSAPEGEERATVERILSELGPPLRVAQAYSQELVLEEAVATGRLVAVTRALWFLATTSLSGFAWALLVFTGWMIGVSFLAIAVIKVIFPNNVAVFTLNGEFYGAGAEFGLPPGVVAHPFGYWVVPASLAVGLAILVGTQRASRRVLGWLRARKAPARLRLRVEVKQP